MGRETSTGGAEARFHTTLWTVVRSAGEGAPEALDELVASYWKPVYFFVRRSGFDVEAAKDLTQSYFGAFLERGLLRDLAPERGRFRSFLVVTLRNFLANERDRAGALKRGGHLDFERAEDDLAFAGPTPEEAFFKGWALSVLERAMGRLRSEVSAEDLAILSGGEVPGLTPVERKHRAYRLRAKLRGQLRELLRPATGSDRDLESEVRELLKAAGK